MPPTARRGPCTMPQFTLTQLLMTVALVAILLGMANSEGCGTRYCKVSDLAFSPDGKHLVAVQNTARRTNASLKDYLADVSRTISILDAATGKTERIVEQEKRSGYQGPAFGLYRDLQKVVAYGPQGKSLLVQQFGGGSVKSYDLLSGKWQSPLKNPVCGQLFHFAVTPDGSAWLPARRPISYPGIRRRVIRRN